jgi:hypothetical protein
VIKKYFNWYFWCDMKSIYHFFDKNKNSFFIKTKFNYNMQIEILLKYILQKIDGPARFYKKNIISDKREKFSNVWLNHAFNIFSFHLFIVAFFSYFKKYAGVYFLFSSINSRIPIKGIFLYRLNISNKFQRA